MLTKVRLKNFKSQVDLAVDLGRFTAFTGYNAAGKTTVLQSLVFLKQSLSRNEATFNDYLLRLGDFGEAVFDHDEDRDIEVEVTLDHDGVALSYRVTVGTGGVSEGFSVDGEPAWTWDARSPHSMEPSGRLFLAQAAHGYGGGSYVECGMPPDQVALHQRFVVDWFENMLYLSSSRGFTKYNYPLMAGKPEPGEVAKRTGEATLLEEWLSNLIMYRINEASRYPKLRPQLDRMRERLGRVGVTINPYVMDGPSVVIDLSEGELWVSAVNSGYGINQLVSFVALGTLLPKGALVMIEEPEIHLHPKLQRIVCDILAEIADEGKQVVITTHSEHFLKTLAKRIGAGALDPADLKAYHFEKRECKAVLSSIDVTDQELLEQLF